MTREDFISMAQEAGFKIKRFSRSDDGRFPVAQRSDGRWVDVGSELAQFAAMVAASERERVAAEFDRRAVYSDGTPASGWYEPHEPAEIVRGMK